MIVVTTETVSGKTCDALSFVRGSVVWSKHFGRDFMASMKTIVGGEIKSYTEMLTEARDIALQRMIADAEALGADAIVCARFSTSSIMQGAAEVMAYGTAVKFL
jgi:uncharacterized protein YbjQ (UPF0145 family)